MSWPLSFQYCVDLKIFFSRKHDCLLNEADNSKNLYLGKAAFYIIISVNKQALLSTFLLVCNTVYPKKLSYRSKGKIHCILG
jgi:hypothetical protein